MQDKQIERKIITGMIVSTDFLLNISDTFKPEYLSSRASKNIAIWCMDYFKQYEKAPKAEIEDFLSSTKLKDVPKEEAEDYISILDSLSKEYDESEYNIQYLTDEAFKYFGIQSVKNHIDELKTEVDKENITKAKELITKFNIVEKPQTKGEDPFDPKFIHNMFSGNSDDLFHYTGDFGDLLDGEFYPESFFVILAPQKRGKTFQLIDMAIQALKYGNKVAFFQGGDLSSEKWGHRFHTYLNKRNTNPKYCGEHYSPIPDCAKNQNGTCNLEFRESNIIYLTVCP